MAVDPGLVADTCVYMEAVAGDGGNHNANGVWWLSPDIALTGATSGPDKADPGANNTVDVTFHLKSNCALLNGPESISIQLFVANPSLAMAPDNAASTTYIDSIGMPVPAPGGAATYSFTWTPPSGLPASDPQSPGHKCLVARAFPENLIPSSTGFFVPADQHVAQRNICVVPCGTPGAAKRPGPCGQTIASVNPLPKAALLDLRAVFDGKPDKHVLQTVMGALRNTKGFQRLSPTPPRAMALHVKEGRGSLAAAPKTPRGAFRGMLKAEAHEPINLLLAVDLAGAKLGDAFIIHVTQAAERVPHGGLTVVMVAV